MPRNTITGTYTIVQLFYHPNEIFDKGTLLNFITNCQEAQKVRHFTQTCTYMYMTFYNYMYHYFLLINFYFFFFFFFPYSVFLYSVFLLSFRQFFGLKF